MWGEGCGVLACKYVLQRPRASPAEQEKKKKILVGTQRPGVRSTFPRDWLPQRDGPNDDDQHRRVLVSTIDAKCICIYFT